MMHSHHSSPKSAKKAPSSSHASPFQPQSPSRQLQYDEHNSSSNSNNNSLSSTRPSPLSLHYAATAPPAASPASSSPNGAASSFFSTSATGGSNEGERWQVAVRIRPLASPEAAVVSSTFVQHECVTQISPQSLEFHRAGDASTIHSFHRVFGPQDSQHELMGRVGQPVVDSILQGFNACILAYGQTGSGKSWTMNGVLNSQRDEGLIPRVIRALLQHGSSDHKIADFHMSCTYVEVYNEDVYDLLTSGSSSTFANSSISLKTDCNDASHTQRIIQSVQQAQQYLNEGQARRKTASTNKNTVSSRSHAIFTLNLSFASGNAKFTPRLTMVDLAGSECSESAGTKGAALKEGSAINTSLLALKQVITSLVAVSAASASTSSKSAPSNVPHVNYRDSKLTLLLQPCLSGQARVSLIANVSSASAAQSETANTLRFTQCAKSLKLKANRVAGGVQLMSLKSALSALGNDQRTIDPLFRKQLIRLLMQAQQGALETPSVTTSPTATASTSLPALPLHTEPDAKRRKVEISTAEPHEVTSKAHLPIGDGTESPFCSTSEFSPTSADAAEAAAAVIAAQEQELQQKNALLDELEQLVETMSAQMASSQQQIEAAASWSQQRAQQQHEEREQVLKMIASAAKPGLNAPFASSHGFKRAASQMSASASIPTPFAAPISSVSILSMPNRLEHLLASSTSAFSMPVVAVPFGSPSPVKSAANQRAALAPNSPSPLQSFSPTSSSVSSFVAKHGAQSQTFQQNHENQASSVNQMRAPISVSSSWKSQLGNVYSPSSASASSVSLPILSSPQKHSSSPSRDQISIASSHLSSGGKGVQGFSSLREFVAHSSVSGGLSPWQQLSSRSPSPPPRMHPLQF